jgi:hypothetical protein
VQGLLRTALTGREMARQTRDWRMDCCGTEEQDRRERERKSEAVREEGGVQKEIHALAAGGAAQQARILTGPVVSDLRGMREEDHLDGGPHGADRQDA